MRLLEASKDHCNLYFLFFASPNEEQSQLYKTYGQAIYWKDFESAQQLIKSIIPDKVVFLYIESYNHVVLNLACKEAGIPTYLLEHGLRADYVVGFDPSISPAPKRSLVSSVLWYIQLIRDFTPRLKSRKFLNNSLKQLQIENHSFAEEFIKVRKHHNYLQTSKKVAYYKRTPETYISFSPQIFKIHQKEERFKNNKQVYFIGIPYFDHLANISEKKPIKSILFFDQPLAEHNLLGWTKDFKESFSQNLATTCNDLGYELLVKLHPTQSSLTWQQLAKQYRIKLVSDEDIMHLTPHLRLVVGFYSTYLLPFAALKHITVVTYENHPAGNFMLSKALTKSGVANVIYNLQELKSIVGDLSMIHHKQLNYKANFIADWLYKFDGQSGKRLKEILTSENYNLITK